MLGAQFSCDSGFSFFLPDGFSSLRQRDGACLDGADCSHFFPVSGLGVRRFWYPGFHLPIGQAILEFRFFEPQIHFGDNVGGS